RESFRQQNRAMFPQRGDSPRQLGDKFINLATQVGSLGKVGRLARPRPRVSQPGLSRTIADQARPALSVVRRESPELASRIVRAADTTDVNVGKRIAALQPAVPKMTRQERFNLTETLRGKAQPLNDSVSQAAK